MEMNDAKLIEFTHIPPEAGVWRQVLDLGTRLRFRKGEEIMHGGEKGEYLYYVHQGEARLMRTTLDGREKILMSMRSGTVTGETPFFDSAGALWSQPGRHGVFGDRPASLRRSGDYGDRGHAGEQGRSLVP